MIIYDIEDKKILNASVTKDSTHEEELMKSDYIRLSWRSASKVEFAVGSYIMPFEDEVKYFLFQPYSPEQVSEAEWKYDMQFQHPLRYLMYVPYVYKTKDFNGKPITKVDWSYTGGTNELLVHICDSINEALKSAALLEGNFTIKVIKTASTNIKDSTEVSFSSVDILSALSAIASEHECEWHLSWADKTLYFGDITLGEEVTLKVGENIKVASIRSNKDGYYNAFLVHGGEKNMAREVTGGEYISASTHLTLDESKYPDGYIYVNAQGEVITKAEFEQTGLKKLTKVIALQDIFPKLDLYVYNVRERTRILIDGDGNKVVDKVENGVTYYKRYADYYIRLAYPLKDENGNVVEWKDFDGVTESIPAAKVTEKFATNDSLYCGLEFPPQYNGFMSATSTNNLYEVEVVCVGVQVKATLSMALSTTRPALFVLGTAENYDKFVNAINTGGKIGFVSGIDYTKYKEAAGESLDFSMVYRSLVVGGKKLSCFFKANQLDDAYPSPLAGRDFELEYLDYDKTITAGGDNEDTGVVITNGDFRIVREDGDIIIPTTTEGGLYPYGDLTPTPNSNIVNLYNIVMPNSYLESAQVELENTAKNVIKQYYTDQKTYTCKSNPVSFEKNNPNLFIGRKVVYEDTSGYRLATRVMKLSTRLDFPALQDISMGNLVIKGTQQQMREEISVLKQGNLSESKGVVTQNVSQKTDISSKVDVAFMEMFFEAIDTNGKVIPFNSYATEIARVKFKQDICSVGDISAFGYVKTELPSASVVIDQILTSGTEIAKINGTPIYAPAGGGGTTNFAALTLKINGLNEQYIPTGDSKIFDLDAVYAKKGEGGNVNLDDYYKKTEIETLLKGYAKTSDIPTDYVTNDTLATAVTNVKAYTDGKISALNIDLYATNQALTQAINGANTTAYDYATQAYNEAVDYADGKFVTLNTEQEITAAKKFVSMYDFFGTQSDGICFYNHDSNGVLIGHYGSNYYGDDSYLQFRNGDWKGYVQFMKGIVGNVNVKNGGIEIFDTMPYIDFHYGNSTADFTSRIIESASGVLELFSSSYNPGTLKIGNAYITYDSDNNALFVKGKDGASVNLVATGDVAAFSGLGSGFDTLTDLTLTNKLKAKYIQATSSLTAVSATIGGVKFYEDDDHCPVIDLSGDGENVGYITGADAFIMGRALVKKLQLYDSKKGNYKDIKYDGDNGYVYITIDNVKYKFVMEKV